MRTNRSSPYRLIFTEELDIIRYPSGKRKHIPPDEVTAFGEELYLVNFLLVSKDEVLFPVVAIFYANFYGTILGP